MPTIDLHESDPTLLVDSTTPPELLEAILELANWDQKSLETANLLITVWSSSAIARPNDRESVSEMQRIIHYALHRSTAAASLPEEYRYRWEEASDLLEARRLNLAHADPDAQLGRKHVIEILQLLFRAGGEFPQSRLAPLLGDISSGRVTQLIGPLEANGLITKRKHGRDNLLALTDIGLRHAGKSVRETAPHKPRALSYIAA
ncbi:MAG: hypothetical protein HGB15_10620 [Chlorobaculum sp.]|nr:hypothetical protein [Chlorobaculum sp.]